MIAHPLPSRMQAYWVLPGRFLAGEYPAHIESDAAAARLDDLLGAGIDTFINLTQADELESYAALLEERAARRRVRVWHERFPIVDLGLPEPRTMQRILDRIDEVLAQGHRVYLHCWGGVGRTGMTVGCFLVRHGMTGPQALSQIAEWRQAIPKRQYSLHSPETPEQVQFVLDWREGANAGRP